MGNSVGLALYLFAKARLVGQTGHGLPSGEPAGQSRNRPGPAYPQRPDAPLIWFHAPSPEASRIIAELTRTMRSIRRDVRFLVTRPAETGPQSETPALPGSPGFAAGTFLLPLPVDAPLTARRFVEHWRPSLAVFADGAMLPALLMECHSRKIPLFMINARPDRRSLRWLPRLFGVPKSLLQRFDRILVQSAEAARVYRRLGAPAWKLETAGKMETSAAALPCTEAERDAMAALLQSRPVWLAISVSRAEEALVLSALRLALRLSHRLLLILVPEDPARGPALAETISDSGLNVSLRSRDEDPDQEDQVYVADTEGEFGLWYRLAPMTFIGGTLAEGNRRRHPFEAAALGSAILHGPLTEPERESYARLTEARAARLVRNAMDLGDAVSDLMSPEKAALLAHAAWAVASSGAEVAERVQQLLLETLATLEENDGARPLLAERAAGQPLQRLA